MECPICFVAYDNAKKVPRNIGCGHTLCHECVEVLVGRNNHTCPVCRKGFEKKRSADNFPRCYALLQLADKREQEAKQGKLVCAECKINECNKCASFSKQQVLENMNKMLRLVSRVPVKESYNLMDDVQKMQATISYNLSSLGRHCTYYREKVKAASGEKTEYVERCRKYYDKLINLLTIKKKQTIDLIEREFTGFSQEAGEQIETATSDMEELKKLSLELSLAQQGAFDLSRREKESEEHIVEDFHDRLCNVKTKVTLIVQKQLRQDKLSLPNIVFRNDVQTIVESLNDKVDIYALGKRYGDQYV